MRNWLWGIFKALALFSRRGLELLYPRRITRCTRQYIRRGRGHLLLLRLRGLLHLIRRLFLLAAAKEGVFVRREVP